MGGIPMDGVRDLTVCESVCFLQNRNIHVTFELLLFQMRTSASFRSERESSKSIRIGLMQINLIRMLFRVVQTITKWFSDNRLRFV